MDREKWLRWRHGGVGGSDAPIIVGVSPYMTKLELYEQKILPEPKEKEGNFVTERGNRYEPRIRARVSIDLEIEFGVALLSSELHPWRRVSLDGRSACGKKILEIKTAGKEDHESARQGKVPDKYWPQVQHALDVARAEVCYYASYHDPEWDEKAGVKSDCLAIVEVRPDPEYMDKLFVAELDFWDCVQNRNAPAPSERDWKKLRGYADLAKQYAAARARAAEVEAEVEKLRAELLAAAKEAGHPRLVCGDLKLIQVTRAGSIDYSKVPQLKGVDLEPYRKAPVRSWRID